MRRFPIQFTVAVTAVLALLPAPDALANRGSPTRPITEKDFNVKNFSAGSIDIDNRFLPLAPGTTFTLTGTANRGGAGGRHAARARALQLDKRAYRLAAGVYRGTPLASVRND